MQKDEFFIEEYKSLRAEIYNLVGETRKLEILALGSIAAMYAWFATRNLSFSAPWFAPVLLPIFGGFRSYTLFRRIKEIGNYLRDCEKRWDCLGWETYFASHIKTRISSTAWTFWVTLLVITLIAPWLLTKF